MIELAYSQGRLVYRTHEDPSFRTVESVRALLRDSGRAHSDSDILHFLANGQGLVYDGSDSEHTSSHE